MRYKRNEPLSVFDGVPVTTKDGVGVVSCLLEDMLPAFCSLCLLIILRFLIVSGT